MIYLSVYLFLSWSLSVIPSLCVNVCDLISVHVSVHDCIELNQNFVTAFSYFAVPSLSDKTFATNPVL